MSTNQQLCYNCFSPLETPGEPCPRCGFDLADNVQKFPTALRAGTTLNNRYIVGRVLGQGGFGITYLAFDTQLQAKVAVKEYMPGEMATRVEGNTVSVMMNTRAEDFAYGAERFQEEARTLAKFIGHPNIAGVSSYFDENGTSYFVMDYIEGVSFKSYIANNGGKVSVDDTLNVMIPVLRALTAVHAEGFIHRDVTPDNIYISKDGNVKLLDFGSARYSIGDKSKSLDVILKVGYAPKEQYIRRGRQGPFTDVYSCAACFYAALTGYLPPESLERLDHDELVPVSQVLPDIPEWLDKAILKGLAVQPEDRFQSAAEFLDAIENQIAVDVPVSGGQSPQPEAKKPKTALIAGIAAALAVVIGVGAFMAGRGGGGEAVPAAGDAAGIAGDAGTPAPAEADDGLPPLKKAEVPSITIRGQEYSTDLRELDLTELGSTLSDQDIQPLKYMINLVKLQLPPVSQISDLSPLSGLTELRILNIHSGDWLNSPASKITDLSPLAGLPNLTELMLLTGPLETLDPLAGMTQLEQLYLATMTPVENYDALSSLTGLQTLRIQICTYGTDYTVEDFRFLSPLTKLQTLTLTGFCPSSLEGLEPLTELRSLSIRSLSDDYAKYMDLDPLAGLTKLQRLDLPDRGYVGGSSGGAPPYDIQGLAGLTELTELSMPAAIQDLGPLANLTKLQTLSINGGHGIDTDLSPLSGLTELTSLTINVSYSAHPPLDLAPLATLTKMQNLSITSSGRVNSGPAAVNLSALANMKDLGVVELWITNLSDISPLRNLENLQLATIRDFSNQISDWSPVDHVPYVQKS